MHRPEAARWLKHPLRWQRGPVSGAAVVRGALGMGPLLAVGVASGHPREAVLAGLGAMFAGINDRPGTWRAGVLQMGVPAVGGALGVLLGVAGAEAGWWAVPLLAVVAVASGAVSVAGPVGSAAAVQLLVFAAVGSGMPLAVPAWVKAGCYLAGAGWIVLLRVAWAGAVHGRPTAPGRSGGGGGAGERLAVAAVFDALGDALAAVGTADAESARRRLTAALDRADEALWLRSRLPVPWERRAGRRRPAERFGAAAALCEAAVALLWEGERLPERVTEGPRRLAEAVRNDGVPGPLPTPVADSPARIAFDEAVLAAGLVFGGGSAAATAQAPGTGRFRRGVAVWGPAGREYGLRVGVCVGASTAVALVLRADHWYWLPATAAFLVKPDYGPLFSRVVNRFAGTAVGVLAFAALAAAVSFAAPGSGWWGPVAAVTAAGLLMPLAVRHFAFQTAVVTLAVLAFVTLGGDTQAAAARLADTAIACAIVLLVGHLPRLVDTRARVGHRTAHALRHTLRYLEHVITAPAHGRDPRQRADLRRAAYHALAEARAAAESAAAELRTRPDPDWLRIAAGAERIADAATACAVRLEHGAPVPGQETVRRVTAVLAEVAAVVDGTGGRVVVAGDAEGCLTLDGILDEAERLSVLAAG
ncbi:FUSC family protein [Kitasatospora paracochleata]|uniref:Membrane protein YccC n=1 Tax=Kitasatospora paracochleata TaxID=58354 RepID=A0ABT1J8Q5_9ACTN|nr:FUSC family protein [Kitasatospora paracochleata]MCP2313820.1 putative membrane protein YccC [Kitasatospora paracochleata]